MPDATAKILARSRETRCNMGNAARAPVRRRWGTRRAQAASIRPNDDNCFSMIPFAQSPRHARGNSPAASRRSSRAQGLKPRYRFGRRIRGAIEGFAHGPDLLWQVLQAFAIAIEILTRSFVSRRVSSPRPALSSARPSMPTRRCRSERDNLRAATTIRPIRPWARWGCSCA